MRLVAKAVVSLVVLAGVGLVGAALFVDLPAPSREISLPVEAR
jgi:hypothetical protein